MVKADLSEPWSRSLAVGLRYSWCYWTCVTVWCKRCQCMRKYPVTATLSERGTGQQGTYVETRKVRNQGIT